ncbi:hypothetical protein BC826DRAFT_967454 [Russula brevipes]|nr:hypothetical protein BC826DRAFT_967454 [Russula brevipes]
MTRPIQDTLDSTIRNAVGFLPKSDKMDVLLCTMERLPMNDKSHPWSRRVIRAYELIFSVPSLELQPGQVMPHFKICGLFSNLILIAARLGTYCPILMERPNQRPEMHGSMVQVSNTYKVPHLPAELWREVVSYLSRRDLRNLVSVPHILSSIARQFLFKDLTLQLGTGKWDETHEKDVLNPNELDKWHAQRSAEIICRLNSDAAYARQVRSLTILVSQHSDSEDAPFSFFMAMLTGVITKLVNLTTFKCRADNNALTQVLEILEKSHPDLQELAIFFGYDAPIWGVIPSLIHLRALSMDVPENLPSGLCGWLVPRTVVALALELGSSTTINCDELIPGLPTGLKVLALPELEDLGNNLSLLPALRLVYFSAQSRFRTVCPADGEFTDLGVRQGDYYMDDLLVQLDCEEAEFIFTP